MAVAPPRSLVASWLQALNARFVGSTGKMFITLNAMLRVAASNDLQLSVRRWESLVAQSTSRNPVHDRSLITPGDAVRSEGQGAAKEQLCVKAEAE
mmetsp:Transcript_16660/g.42023  ORF Transcript_16660/g.42023 Transcript_16660/m.42023 type:complete len:96 (-) Transcript_16660:170-457(-)